MPALTGAALVADGRSPRRSRRRSTDRTDSISGGPDGDRELVFAEGRRRSATRMPETTPVGLIPARSPRVAWATSGSADIAIATPNASAKAPARPMYLANPNALVSCHV